MATPLKSGSYRTQVFTGYKDGKRQYKSFTAESARKADYLALQWQIAHPHGETSNLRLDTAIESYIEAKNEVLSASTIRSYNTILRQLRGAKIASKKLEDITKRDMQAYINMLSANHASKTVRNYYGLIGAVFNANEITMPRCTLPQKTRPTYNIPDEETLKRLFEGAKGTDLEIPILLAAIGPMRRGEIVGARLSDLNGDELHVCRCVVMSSEGERVKDYPKNYSSDRYILLPHEVAELIRDKGYIYDGSLNNISKAFPKLLDKLGIERFRFHDLRHAFVSIAHAAGQPDKYIQDRGGWSTPYTMNAVYKHTLNADSRKEQERINDVFRNLL